MEIKFSIPQELILMFLLSSIVSWNISNILGLLNMSIRLQIPDTFVQTLKFTNIFDQLYTSLWFWKSKLVKSYVIQNLGISRV